MSQCGLEHLPRTQQCCSKEQVHVLQRGLTHSVLIQYKGSSEGTSDEPHGHPNSAWHHPNICQIKIPLPAVHLLAFEVFLHDENTHKKGNHWKNFLKNMCHFIGLDTLQNQSP